MTEDNILTSEHEFYYQTEGAVTARSLADSLVGLEGLVLESKSIISVLLGGEAIKDIEVLITSVEIASYKDMFSVRLLLGKGQKLEKNIEKLRKTLRLDKMDSKTVIKIAISGVILFVAYQQLKPEDPARIQITNSFNTIGATAGISGDDMRGVIETLVGKTRKQTLARRVSQLVNPDGVKSEGDITIDKDTNLKIPASVVRTIPVQAALNEEIDQIEDLNDKQVVIRALDLDNHAKGWWAILPDISERRLPIHVDSKVVAGKVPIGCYFHADVTVIYSINSKGEKKPKQYILRSLSYPAEKAAPVINLESLAIEQGEPKPKSPR